MRSLQPVRGFEPLCSAETEEPCWTINLDFKPSGEGMNGERGGGGEGDHGRVEAACHLTRADQIFIQKIIAGIIFLTCC